MAKHEAPGEHPVRDALSRLLGSNEDEQPDWDVTKHGRMRDYATAPEDEPATTAWEG